MNTLMIAKPEKARQAEAMLVQMARTGQIGGRMSEDDLVRKVKQTPLKDRNKSMPLFQVNFLQRFGSATSSSSKVKFDRRRAALDDDSD